MDLREFARTYVPGSTRLDGFFSSGQGAPYAGVPAASLGKKAAFDAFKDAAADHARDLFGRGRLELYQQVSDLCAALRQTGNANVSYNLKQSFLGDDEVDLIVMRELHTPMTREALAAELRCSRNAVGERMDRLKDGVRLGDLSVRMDPRRGGVLESTVHPVLLPLNLSEVYLLLKVLGEEARDAQVCDPHGEVALSLARRVHSQLSDYAKGCVDERLAEQGLKAVFLDEKPEFCLETAGGPRGSVRYNDSLLYYFKSGCTARVLYNKDGAPVEVAGKLVDGRFAESRGRLPEGVDPSGSLVVLTDDGGAVVIPWDQVIDVQEA